MEERSQSMIRQRTLPSAPAVAEELLTGRGLLHRAFLEAPVQSANRAERIVSEDDANPPVFLITRGSAYSACTLPDGRRAILELLLPDDFGGVDHIVVGCALREYVAASPLGYRSLSAAIVRDLMSDRAIALTLFALGAEAQRRLERHAATLTRFDARERIGTFLLDVYDRLRRHQLIGRPTFNLHLTQEQIADHLGLTMVHVNRTLRHLREERVAIVDRHVVIIMDVERLRGMVRGLPALPLTDTEADVLDHVPQRVLQRSAATVAGDPDHDS